MPKDEHHALELTPSLVLRAYAAGVFPMADSADAESVFWVDPKIRGVIPLDRFRVSRRLARRMRADDHRVTVDREFEAVIDACAGRDETWINGEIRDLFVGLHRMGHGHSIEVWMEGELAGGLYGVRLGAAFFGESMFHRRTDASKIALVHLVARLRAGGFMLLDTQFVTDHLAQFGAERAPRARYHRMLEAAVRTRANFFALPQDAPVSAVLQLASQTS